MVLSPPDFASLPALGRLAIEGRGLGTFVVDDDDHVCVDARAAALFGFAQMKTVAETSATPTLAQLAAQLHDDDRADFTGALQTRGAWRGDVRCTATVPARVLDVGVGVDEAGRVVGVVEDVSDARRVVAALARAERARDVIAGSLADDLRAPVFHILMAADVLSRDGDDAAALRRVLSGARRVHLKIEELVCFAQLSIGGLPLTPDRLDLQALIGRCVERAVAAGFPDEAGVAQQSPRLAPAAEARPAVTVVARGDTTGSFDGALIGAALLTLLDNALRHARPAVAHVDVDGSDDSVVVVRVENAGAIRPELLASLFELVRAPRGDAAFSGGLGLGLYNARRIAVAHGGDLTVTSSTTTGTTFTLRLPRRAAFARASALDEPVPPNDVDVVAGARLQERAPSAHWRLLDRYTRLLEVSLHRRLFKNAGEALPEEVVRLADALGALHASARDVADLHASALRRASLLATPTKAQALVTEGRLLSLELMGRLLSYYRKRARPSAPQGDAP